MLTSLTALLFAASHSLAGPVGGGWSLLNNEFGCSIWMVGQSGGRMEFAIFNSNPETVSMIVSNNAWTSLAEDRAYTVKVTFGRKEREVPAVGYYVGGTPGIAVNFPRLEWIDNSLKRETFGVEYENQRLWYSYAPPMRALLALNRCINGQRDVFAP